MLNLAAEVEVAKEASEGGGDPTDRTTTHPLAALDDEGESGQNPRTRRYTHERSCSHSQTRPAARRCRPSTAQPPARCGGAGRPRAFGRTARSCAPLARRILRLSGRRLRRMVMVSSRLRPNHASNTGAVRLPITGYSPFGGLGG